MVDGESKVRDEWKSTCLVEMTRRMEGNKSGLNWILIRNVKTIIFAAWKLVIFYLHFLHL